MRQWAWHVRPAAPCVREYHSQAHHFEVVKKAEKCYKNTHTHWQTYVHMLHAKSAALRPEPLAAVLPM